MIIERPLFVPDATFIKQQVTRAACSNRRARSAGCGGIEIIFDQFGFRLRLVVLVKGAVVGQRLGSIVECSNIVGIHNRMPLAVQVCGVASVDAGDQRCDLSCASLAIKMLEHKMTVSLPINLFMNEKSSRRPMFEL